MSIQERAVDFQFEPKFKTKKRRPRAIGGFSHSRNVQRRNQEAAMHALEEVRNFINDSGEPSQAFFPQAEIAVDPFEVEGVVFIPARREISGREVGKKIVHAKINRMLEHPEEFQITSEGKRGYMASFIERHFRRIVKFAKTARNKGKLNPGMERLLEPELSPAESSVST